MTQMTDSFITQAEEALTLMEQVGSDGWCLCVKNGAQGTVESALRSLLGEYKRLTTITEEMVDRAADGIERYDDEQPSGMFDIREDNRGKARAALVAALEGEDQ